MPNHPLNIVLIVTDQQRFDSLGCTGNPHARTPNLDALARQATIFTRHFTSAPVCMPSRASLMTGRYPASHGVWNNGTPLPNAAHVPINEALRSYQARIFPAQLPVSHVPTLAESFAAAGYATGSVGKLHLTPNLSDARLGFEESEQRWEEDPTMAGWHGPYFGFEEVDLCMNNGEHVKGQYTHWLTRTYPELAARLAEGYRPDSLRFPEVHDLYPGLLPIEAHPTSWAANCACDFIDRRAADRRPFLLSVGFPDPHHPFTPPASLTAEFETRDVQPVGAPFSSLENVPEILRRFAHAGKQPLRPEAIRMVRQYTNAMIHLIDRAVGQIIAQLQASGLWEDTAFIFTSDHGDYMGDYGLIRKTNLASRVLNHVPLILFVPGGTLPREVAIPASHVDVLPTLCALAGATVPPGVQGESLLEIVSRGRRQPVMIQSTSGNPLHTNLSLVDETCRFTFYPTAGLRELYDHTNDPFECQNLAGRDHPAEAPMYTALLEAFTRSIAPGYGRVALW